MADIDRIKMILRESDIPFFTDEQINFYLSENNGDVDATVYQCLLIKAENTTLSVSGISAADSSAYFRKLASKYRPNNSGVMKGG